MFTLLQGVDELSEQLPVIAQPQEEGLKQIEALLEIYSQFWQDHLVSFVLPNRLLQEIMGK